MAEGLFDGVLGGEEDKSAPTEGRAEAFAAAVAGNLAKHSPEVAAETVVLFRKQTEALEVQKKNLEAELEFFEAECGCAGLRSIELGVGAVIRWGASERGPTSIFAGDATASYSYQNRFEKPIEKPRGRICTDRGV